MSDNHSEEEFVAQLQLALLPAASASDSFPAFRIQDAYWEFLNRALLHNLPRNFNDQQSTIGDRHQQCMCGRCGSRNRDAFAPWSVAVAPPPRYRPMRPAEFFPNPYGDAIFPEGFRVEPEKPSNRCVMCFDDLKSPDLDAQFPIDDDGRGPSVLSDETQMVCRSSGSCLDPHAGLPSGIACPRNHLICRGCLDNLIVDRCSTVLHTPSTPSQIDCPSCQAARALSHMMLKPNVGSVASYTSEQLRHACGGASEQALELLTSVALADEKLATMSESEQLTTGNTDCYLCPKCKFGPVAHQACADLRAHHGSQGVSNKCPKCGFLGSNITEWIQIAEPRTSTPATRPRRGRGGAAFDIITSLWPIEDFVERWRPQRNTFQRNDWREERERSRPGFRDLEAAAVPTFMTPFHFQVEPSFWDGVMRRLMQTAWAANDRSTAPASTFSRLAIGDGSEACGSNTAADAGSAHAASSDALQLSLVHKSHHCLRVQCAHDAQTFRQWSALACIDTALHLPPAPANYGMRLGRDAALCLRLFEKAFLASINSINSRLAIENGSQTDGEDTQLVPTRRGQLACLRVV